MTENLKGKRNNIYKYGIKVKEIIKNIVAGNQVRESNSKVTSVIKSQT
jgi:hypothetical protein